jgi:hypothetical protein
LVPNEKNSPTSAISPAFSAARGSSIIVPTRYSIRAALLGEHGLRRPCRRQRLHELQLAPGGDQRDHHLGDRRLAGLLRTSTAASKIARACIS